MALRPADEHPHDAEGRGWSETWSFDLASADGELGGWVAFTRFADHAWYQAMLAGPRRQLLAVLDHDVPFRSNPLEVRTTGLWADHVCETAYDHWTIGLETFAVGLDDPLELHGRQHGDNVALGFDLEWESAGPVLELDHPGGVAYEVPCHVHGEVLVGQGAIELDGVGWRSHRWGSLDWAADEGWHLTGVVEGDRRWSLDQRGGVTTVRTVEPDGEVRVRDGVGEVAADDHGMPRSARVECDAGQLRVEVLAVTPVPLTVGDRTVRRPRALCRLRVDDGSVGVGWIELRGPARPALDHA